MADMPTTYVDEKRLEVLPMPVTQGVPLNSKVDGKARSPGRRLCRIILTILGTFLVLNLLRHGPAYYIGSEGWSRGCHRLSKTYAFAPAGFPDVDETGAPSHHHQHPFPPIDKWRSYNGTTHFPLDSAYAAGLTVKGASVFGKVVFDTSKLSDKVVIDLDIRTNGTDEVAGEISVTEEDGVLTINTPDTGALTGSHSGAAIYASAHIQIPSNIIGTFGLPSFTLNLPRHMVDYSALPESLEIGSLTIRLAKGFVRPGPVHTNATQISIASGALRGKLTHARHTTSVDVAHGNVTLDVTPHSSLLSSLLASSSHDGVANIHLGNGHFRGSVPVYNETSIDVAHGAIWATVAFHDGANERARLSTKIGAGPARVYVESIAAERLLEAYHTSLAGDQLITYPTNFQGTIDARDIAGAIKLAGDGVQVEKVLGGVVGRKGDSERNSVSVKAVKGALDILVGDDKKKEN